MKNLTPELIKKAKAAKSAEELLTLAKANGVELTEDEAKTYFEQLNANGAVADDELDAVVGGGSCPSKEPLTVQDLPVGSLVEVLNGNYCPGCGGKYGVSQILHPPHPERGYTVLILCTKCQEVILYPVTEPNIHRII